MHKPSIDNTGPLVISIFTFSKPLDTFLVGILDADL